MGVPLHVLIVEDSEIDFLFLVQELRRGGYDPVCERVETGEAMTGALDREDWDAILIDYTLPRFSGIAALELIKRRHIDLPAIIVSGTIDEETAVAAMKAGARDYIMKTNLARLVPAIERELQEARVRVEQRLAKQAFRESEERYRSLFEHSMDAVFLTTPDGKIIAANPAACRMFGYSENELIKLGRAGLTDTADPRLPAALKERTRTGKFQGELTCLRRDKTRFPVEVTSSIFRDSAGNSKTSMLIRDLSERKKMENALRESEMRFQELFAHMPAGVSVYEAVNGGKDFLYSDINKAGERISHITRDEIVGKSIQEIFPGVRGMGLWDVLARVWKTGRPELLPMREYRDQRISLWVENYIYKLPSGEIAAIYEDITARKQAEEALRESELRFRIMSDSIPQMIWVTNAEGLMQFVNRAYCEFFGVTLHHVQSEGWQPLIHPDDRDAYVTAYFSCLHAQKPFHSVVRVRRHDSEWRWVESFGQPRFSSTGEFLGLAGSSPDVTERKKAEEMLRMTARYNRNLIEVSLDPLVAIDADGKITDVNVATEMITGYSRKELIGTDFSDYFTDSEKARGGYQLVFKRKYVHDYELAIKHRDGHATPVCYNASVYNDELGNVLGVFAAARNITDRKLAENVLLTSQKQLRALAGRLQAAREEERTQIAREIHDELGGALTAMKIDFSLLGRTVAKIRDKALKDSLHARMDDMKKLIDEAMRTVRRIATGLRPGILDDLGLVAAMEWQLTDFQKRTGIRCEFISSSESIDLDGVRATALFRITQETLTNVARHARATEVRIHLKAVAGKVLLEVEDNGVGIKEEEIQSAKSLGILGMRERALSFGGRVTITGRPGEGTTVAVESSTAERGGQDLETDE